MVRRLKSIIMSPAANNGTARANGNNAGQVDFHFHYFSELYKRPICAGKISDKIGIVSELVFKIAEPYPAAVGIIIDHGWGTPNEFIPFEKILRIEDDAIFVPPAENGKYPPFVDQSGWILVNEHLMGRTIFDMDGRRVEVVNDVHLLESKGAMLLVHVDTSFNGFLRRWGLGKLAWTKDDFISWKFVQPLSLEDVGKTDAVTLSVTRKQIKDVPTEDLADALEELSGNEQVAVFQALDSEKAAEVLIEAEPRAQRQLIANLRKEKVANVLSEMSVPQLAALFTVLPNEYITSLKQVIPGDTINRIQVLLSQKELTASALMSSEFITVPKDAKAGDILNNIRTSHPDPKSIAYIYVVADAKKLIGVLDFRDMFLADPNASVGDLMVSPVVSVEENDLNEDLVEMFNKYHFRLIPVVNPQDCIIGVISHKDVVKGASVLTKA